MQVTSTTSVASTTSTSSSSTSSSSTTLGYDQFLTLLVTEMQNQDPTNPVDSTQTVSQLASFSAVEQQVKTNDTLTSMLASQSLTQAQSFIGKTVTSADGSVSGVVASVTIGSSSQTATLTDGSTIDLTTGITVS
ncbi:MULTISPECIES: flagellar hook assembly protein FlgD [Methylosinus]|uniref:Basal-body rod modification protein FlgD n=1 Tax=Methylosinus trichosporium (strain ATCC 35070 / NCIMB 11131 / UNIQEM 75 / OB3b) TaxID=595536 RepID=A0A2D2D4T7_METT3|nr:MULTISPECIES: flagellar hook assembly protein FlgD [Methylosinus]ATQ69859.1 flagellar basal body rod modification protein [Methylosinus trichosporium OB3b]OBS54492.1 flagellar basal body rod modification protein [Methylosinus sp. 3S-1]